MCFRTQLCVFCTQLYGFGTQLYGFRTRPIPTLIADRAELLRTVNLFQLKLNPISVASGSQERSCRGTKQLCL